MEELEDTLADFITIRYSLDGDTEIDLGSITCYEAEGLLRRAIRKLVAHDNKMRLRYGGEYIDEDEDTEVE